MTWEDLPNRATRFNDLMRQNLVLLERAAKLLENQPLTNAEARALRWVMVELVDIERAIHCESLSAGCDE